MRSGTMTASAVSAAEAHVKLRGKPDLLIVDDDPLISDTLNFVLGTDFASRAQGVPNRDRDEFDDTTRKNGGAP